VSVDSRQNSELRLEPLPCPCLAMRTEIWVVGQFEFFGRQTDDRNDEQAAILLTNLFVGLFHLSKFFTRLRYCEFRKP